MLASDERASHDERPSVTVVLPCLNEEMAIAACVKQAQHAMDSANLNGQVLVVDNGSGDRSVEVAREAGATVMHQPEPGYGATLRSGFEVATSCYVVMADADGTYDLEAIPQLVQPLVDGSADLVIGSRRVTTKESMPWLHRYVGTPVITMLLNRATGRTMNVRDSQSGFRAFRREQLLSLGLTSAGMEFASEMLMRCAWARFRIVEVPTTYSPRIGNSKLNAMSDGMRHLRQILLLSPEIFAIDPGIIMTMLALVLWVLACLSVHGLARTGSLSWVITEMAAVLSVIGPITFCTGLVIKYRAESLGFRHISPRYPLVKLIWRFFFAGIGLIVAALLLVAALIVNFHRHPTMFSHPVQTVLGSVATSAAIVGIVLACAPVLTPFLTDSPRPVLPKVDVDG
jgi:glycosyltransferase involved in cell wall biosynthesis